MAPVHAVPLLYAKEAKQPGGSRVPHKVSEDCDPGPYTNLLQDNGAQHQSAQRVTKENASSISHEDARRGKIEKKESKTTRRKKGEYEYEVFIPARNVKYNNRRDANEDGSADGHPIDAIHEVVHIDEPDGNEQRRQNQCKQQRARVVPDGRRIQQRRKYGNHLRAQTHLRKKLPGRPDVANVVNKADKRGCDPAEPKAEH